MKQYLALLDDVLDFGVEKTDRTGTGTISIFGHQMRFYMYDGFPLVTTKKVHLRSIIHELLWFLKGETTLKYLLDNNVHIWDKWVKPGTEEYRDLDYSERYDLLKAKIGPNKTHELAWESFGAEWAEYLLEGKNTAASETFFDEHGIPDKVLVDGDLGPIYGQQWRRWEEYREILPIEKEAYEAKGYRFIAQTASGCPQKLIMRKEHDQVQNALNILRNDPDSRRIIVNSWNPGLIDQQALTPCHEFFQYYTRPLNSEERKDLLVAKVSEEIAEVIMENWRNNVGEDLTELFNAHGVERHALSLRFDMRSSDTPVGLPFNIASYALLLLMTCQQVDMIPDQLIYQSGDTHIYLDQVDLVMTQLNRSPHKLPKMKIRKAKDLFSYTIDDFELVDYEHDEVIKYPVAI